MVSTLEKTSPTIGELHNISQFFHLNNLSNCRRMLQYIHLDITLIALKYIIATWHAMPSSLIEKHINCLALCTNFSNCRRMHGFHLE